MWQHKGTNVLLSTEKQQQCSCVFVAFCPRNFPKHFLQPCTGCEGAHPTRVLLEGIGLFQPGRFSTVQLCPHVSPPAADTTPRLPATHVASFVHWHTVPTDCFLFSYFYLVWRICLFLSIYHPSHSFSAEFSLLLPQFLSGCFFYYYYFGFFFFFFCWEMRGAHIFFHCWLPTALEKAQASCHLLLLALIVPAASDLHMGIWLFTWRAWSPHQSGKEDPHRILTLCSALFRVFGWPQMEFWKGLDE